MRMPRLAVRLLGAVTTGALVVSTLTAAQAVPSVPGGSVPGGSGPGGAGGSGAGSGTGASGSAGRPAGPGGAIHRITLITGDVAELSTGPGGQRSARLVGERPGAYYLGDFDGDVTLVPAAAYPLLVAGRLDRRLFNLTDLVAQGYDDAHTDKLPLLLSATGSSRRAPGLPAAAVKRRELPSVAGVAVSTEKSKARELWSSIAGTGSARTLGAGVGKVWLDGRTRATLDRSIAQIGAPTAWRAGYDGTGVKVAVLDSGYDAAHPDLAEQVVASASFVPDSDVQDRQGHGTYVAATVAGRGTASQGKRQGVAPGADLLVGKVLDDNGTGLDSEAIAGMEWAVQQGAKVISMSLGGFPTDGTDPMSQAVDQLSASSGALFVVAAGNSGTEESVGTPGAALSALTVGAVDRADKLAVFSSRGPRLGDGALKPEVTAPGVDIAAARAAGTHSGRDLSEYYTAMSGTSMATPHVAGAAAILAQRHPDWTGQQLKAALAATAVPAKATPAVAQGVGRIDLSRALDPKVVPDTAALAFGDLSWTGTAPPPVRRKVGYRNTSRSTITLDLTFEGVQAPSGVRPALKVSPSSLRIPPGGTATAVVELDLARTQPGKYAGVLVARGGGTSYRTGLGFAAGGRLHQVTVKAIGRDGKPAAASPETPSGVQLWNYDTGEVQAVAFDGTGSQTLGVPTGRYTVLAYVMGGDEAGWPNSLALLGEPDVRITASRTFTFDARRAHRTSVTTPRRADPQTVGLAWHRRVGDRTAVSGWSFDGVIASGVYVQDFGRVRDGDFRVLQRWDLAQPQVTVDVTGAGGFRLPTPALGNHQKLYVGKERLQLVDGGDGTPAELTGVRGKVALIRWRDYEQTAAQVQAAADAGARLVLMYNDAPGFWSDSAGPGIPFYLLRQPDGRALKQRLAAGSPVVLQLDGVEDSTYRYELAVSPSVVRGPLKYDIARMRPAVVTSTFHQNAAWYRHFDQRTAYVPGVSTGMQSSRPVTGAVVRTDYLATDRAGTGWEERLIAGEWNFTGFEYSLRRSYRPGERAGRQWWTAISRPAIPAVGGGEADGLPVARFEDAIRAAIPQHVNGDRSAYGWSDNSGDVTSMVLRRNGREVGRTNWSVGQFPVPSATAWYELDLAVQRSADTWATTSTRTRTQWRFRSGTARTRAVLPLVQLDYGLSTDLANRLPARGGAWLDLKAGYQPGASGPGWFRTTAEISFDGGSSWQRMTVLPRGFGKVAARIPAAPAGATEAAIRVTATDLAGNRVIQTIDRAWLLSR